MTVHNSRKIFDLYLGPSVALSALSTLTDSLLLPKCHCSQLTGGLLFCALCWLLKKYGMTGTFLMQILLLFIHSL